METAKLATREQFKDFVQREGERGGNSRSQKDTKNATAKITITQQTYKSENSKTCVKTA